MAARTFAPISIEDLKAKIDAIPDARTLIKALWTDIKVDFDLENFSDSAKDFGPKALMGFHTESNGLTYCGFCAGGDWESPVFFAVYWDGKKLRAYVPTEGNPWNLTTKKAYGNDEVVDGEDAHKRWPNIYKGSAVEPGDFEFNSTQILKDITARIQPAPSKLPVLPSQKIPKIPRTPQPVKNPLTGAKPKSLQERIESLVFYGTGDEAEELFQQTCTLSYKLYGLGQSGKAEVACAWAEEMAYESHSEQRDVDDFTKGHWG
jgi:hypothetical protein